MANQLQRVFGLIREDDDSYGTTPTADSPDFHMEITESSIPIEGDLLTLESGSRGTKLKRPGTYLPQPEIEGVVDLKQITHFLLGALGEYVYTAGTPGSPGTANIHEFYGGENRKLPSFTSYGHFDEFIKKVKGTLITSLSMEVSNEFITLSVGCVAQKDQIIDDMPDATELKTVDAVIPLAFYDVTLELDGETPPGIVSSFKWEITNDISTDDSIGIGSRFLTIKPAAGKRTNTVEMEVSLETDTVKYIRMFEYGDEDADEPSECKIAHIPLTVVFAACEDSSEKLTIKFPDCTGQVEYSASGADAIMLNLTLDSMKTTNVELNDGVTEVETDVYCKLENKVPKVVAGGITMPTAPVDG
jgi:hypothetical protein